MVGVDTRHIVRYGHIALTAAHYLVKTTEDRMFARGVIAHPKLVVFDTAWREDRGAATQLANHRFAVVTITGIFCHQPTRASNQCAPINTEHIALSISMAHASGRITPRRAQLTGQRTAIIKVQFKAAILGDLLVIVNLREGLQTVRSGTEGVNGFPVVAVFINKTVAGKTIGIGVVGKGLPAVIVGEA